MYLIFQNTIMQNKDNDNSTVYNLQRSSDTTLKQKPWKYTGFLFFQTN
jgi:hypothetical protein